jgi:hypothetical protein
MMDSKKLIYHIILFALLPFTCNAQTSAEASAEDFFLGKLYLIVKGMPQGDARMIMSVEKEEGVLSGTVTSPLDPSQLFSLEEITVSGNEISAKFDAFNSRLPITVVKEDDENVSGQLGRFAIEGSKKELFKLEANAKVSPPPQTAKDTASAVVTIEASKRTGKLLRTERYNNITSIDVLDSRDVALYQENGLGSKVLRVWVSDEQIYNQETGEYNYEYVNKYLTAASPATDFILANFKFVGLINEWTDTPEQGKPIVEKMLTDLKSKFPKLRYIEVMNEPDFGPEYLNKMNPNLYYPYYKVVYEAVNKVNTKLNPLIPLEVGGPAVAKFDLKWLTTFLDDFKKDPSPNKKLDFVSWHAYFKPTDSSYAFLKDDPSRVKDQRRLFEEELAKRGLSKDIPSFITEMGIYPGPLFDQQGSFRNDHLRQAAGMASVQYWFLESDHIYPFNWVMRHHVEGRKDQLVTRDEFGDPMMHYGKFTPYGNALVMFAKLKENRLIASTSTPISDGKGIYALASSDSSGVAAMVWNFQSVHNTGYHTEVVFNNLPASFENQTFRVKTYRIDFETSNYHADLENSNLQLVEDKVYKSAKEFKKTVFLHPNALQLLVLEPVSSN